MTDKIKDNLKHAYEIAKKADVSTPPNSIILYSISYLPTDENKQKAFAYKKNHKDSYMLDDTECGKKLIELGLETDFHMPQAELMKIWSIASERFIMAASGNVNAFVDNADKRSTFVSVELPLLIKNSNILTINNIDKYEFLKLFLSTNYKK